MELDSFIIDLLHINDIESNSLMDLGAKPQKTYLLSQKDYIDFGEYVVGVAARTIGKPATTVLRNSALAGEQIVGRVVNALDWESVDGQHDAAQLDKFINEAYKALSQKGANPLFVGVGAIDWKLAGKKDAVRQVRTPLLIYPIRLIRSVNTGPVAIEFINDEVYLNPCFIAKLNKVWPGVAKNFPHPNGLGANLDDAVDLDKLGDGKQYFSAVKKYVEDSVHSSDTVFGFDKDVAVIAPYEHNELCMYYDIRRNRDRIDEHPLVKRVFNKGEKYTELTEFRTEPEFIRSRDTAQERIVRRVVNGESLIIKGPPGTGKTHTIVNMIAALLAANKKVLLSSAKLSALSEVYLQMPDDLREFAMLLECETEAEAAKLNPAAIKKDFANLVAKRRMTGALSPSINEDLRQAKEMKSAAARELTAYVNETFNTRDVMGFTYYEALDKLCGFSGKTIDFVSARIAKAMDRSAFGDITAAVKECGKMLKTITDNGACKYVKCAWTPRPDSKSQLAFASCDKERIIKRFAEIKPVALKLAQEIERAAEAAAADCNNIKLNTLLLLAKGDLDEESARRVLAACKQNAIEEISAALDIYLSAGTPEFDVECEAAEQNEKFTTVKHPDGELKRSDADFINNNIDFLSGIKSASTAERLFALVEELLKIDDEIEQKRTIVAAAFNDGDLSPDDWEKIDKMFGKFEKLRGVQDPKPDFGTNGAFKKLAKLSWLPDVTFVEVVNAVLARKDMLELKEKAKKCENDMCRQFGRRLESDHIKCVRFVYSRCKAAGMPFDVYVSAFKPEYEAMCACMAGTDKDLTINEVAHSVKCKLLLLKLISALKPVAAQTEGGVTPENALTVARNVCALFDVAALFPGFAAGEVVARARTLKEATAALESGITELLDKFKAVGQESFNSYYTACTDELTVGDIRQFARSCTDRDVLNASLEFHSTLSALNLVEGEFSMADFFAPFISGALPITAETDFADIFENSVLLAGVDAKTAALGDRKNGVGRRVVQAFSAWDEAEKKQCAATIKKIASECMGRIDPKDRDFDFLNADKGFDTTLRRLFKNHAREILKLKKCFLLSASTASVLFNSEEFSKFDVVIVDEASQLEPVCALPVLSRAKQCVLVGDELQMPPIHHFGGREDKLEEDAYGETVVLTGDLSVLSLALTNEAFPVEALSCHFRSRTEALIAFSQQRYYPYMRTFPSALPRAVGLGFKDVYIADGACESGVNVPEAKAAVDELRAHFEMYYKNGVLSESAGIVAFGLQQINYIKSLIAEDKELSEKMRLAFENFDDLPENLIFFKTIETVQGQETDHLILSITYGKNKDGKVTQSYGELNRGDLGQRIFNVAVTRAKSSVTVIHSVRPSEITGENVLYIGEYIALAARFAGAQRSVFSSGMDAPAKGFLTQVADVIKSLGISEERIAFNCGVTKGSIRVPIAVLSPDLTCAELGIWCETPPKPGAPYIDENGRYYGMLEGRGWKLHRIYIRDWFYNADAERGKLKDMIRKNVTI